MPADFVDHLTHLLHLVLGGGSVVAAVAALAARKGGRWHRRAGWAFVAGMVVAAITAWGFMVARPLPLAMVSATVTLYALGMALLAIHPRWPGARRWEWGLFALLSVVMAGMLVTSANLFRADSKLFVAPLAMFVIFAIFAWLDWRYLRAGTVARIDRLRRHALRMALAMAQMVMAPLIIVAPDLGVPVPAIVFGSLLLVPLVHFGFAPQARRAAVPAA